MGDVGRVSHPAWSNEVLEYWVQGSVVLKGRCPQRPVYQYSDMGTWRRGDAGKG
jgi:hypothetical protein